MTPRTRALSPLLAIGLVGALMGGCKANKPEELESTRDMKQQILEREDPESGLVLQEVDLDVDGQVDVYNYYRKRSNDRLLVRKEVDLNDDGKVDLISFFDDEGRLKKEQMDSDYDGHFDWTDHYQEGKRVMSEYDTETDGRPNVFKYYDSSSGTSVLSRKERDTDGDGKIDVWERFDKDGNVIRTGQDTDGDGKMDTRSE
ncbi:MAG: hypothetical protein H6736_01235 [Alphaproteobacteria bacterium]|nr:hypothetical protein [Alphaproteobacteria bacterium]MCB9690413.1 hypothetical protein [Alphaproteobacteria bacterium]